MDISKIYVLPWHKQQTHLWYPDELLRIRDDNIGDLTDWLWDSGSQYQQGAVKELLCHGNLKKAVALVRELIEQHPSQEEWLKRQYEGLQNLFYLHDAFPDLYNTPLERFPSSPEEFPSQYEIHYVNIALHVQ